MYGVPDFFNKRALTHQVSLTGLHPLDRHPVETWEGKPPGAAWRMYIIWKNVESCTTPLFHHDFTKSSCPEITPFNFDLTIKGDEILRISEHSRDICIKLRELKSAV
ncbi:hypothetical protein SC499_20980 [Peribacillus simplex]|uniref:hypothetical protein n=1 Tax=Peribacillus simplex TaxID=1478 RepID=UPI00298D7204|nr:hypothetical protein [Peribacillus simplex]MDW7617092.1 hypothetical protein [Peribacillus simplex]